MDDAAGLQLRHRNLSETYPVRSLALTDGPAARATPWQAVKTSFTDSGYMLSYLS